MIVKIRPLEINDAYTSVVWRNIPELWIHTTFKADKKITLDDELRWVKKVISEPTGKRFAIIADGVYVGNIYLIDITEHSGEYHVFIGEKKYWGKGIARAASVEIINYAKNILDLEIITLTVKPGNVGALHLYESLGFYKTGKMNGEFIVMELSLDSWQGDPRRAS